MTWAIEGAANPTVLRLHVSEQLTDTTILTCPPGEPPADLRPLLGIEGIRSLDVHRYMVRINLMPGAGRGSVGEAVAGALVGVWGDAVPLPPEEPPKAFAVNRLGPRSVAEGVEMASKDPILAKVFSVQGVAEAIAEHSLVLVRLGRLFRWETVQTLVSQALAEPA